MSPRVIAGYVVMTTQLLDQVRASEEAIRRHEERCAADPEYYQQWVESVDWDLVESGYEDD